jgi:hypothetical protein
VEFCLPLLAPVVDDVEKLDGRGDDHDLRQGALGDRANLLDEEARRSLDPLAAVADRA